MSASLYPLFLNLKDRTCVVVGGNEMAQAKTRDLLATGARISVIAPQVTSQMSAWAESGRLQWNARAYHVSDLSGAFLVLSVADAETNARVFADAEARHIFCSKIEP